ncbi:MAG TPA: hypothetical protein VNV65_02505 [Candidatus Solibacter sp.]|jgi:hypothetical protein|nr:hypothetical protein [Candidatus Solibacter sp.]
MNSKNGFDLDRQLRSAVRKQGGAGKGPSPHSSQAAYHLAFMAASRPRRFSSLRLATSPKMLAGLAAAVLAVGGGSLAYAAAATGSSDPAVWGKTVTAAVEQCKDQLTNGIHGIGECVSKVAKQNGEDARADHSRGKSGQDHPSGATGATDSGNGHGHGNGNATGRPSGVPTGPPSGVPAGPKNDHPSTPPNHK